jgi:hypothetical protein
MGNKALIAPQNGHIGIELHWNGGRDSINAFLEYGRLAGLPPLGKNDSGIFNFVTVLVNFFGNDGHNVYPVAIPQSLPELEQLNPGDNGIYIVDGWKIIKRLCKPTFEQRDHDLDEMLKAIDAAQPARDKLGPYLDAEEAPVEQIKIGDQIVIRDNLNHETKTQTYPVVAFGENLKINGTNVFGLPHFIRYNDGINGKPELNINNYAKGPTVHRLTQTNQN